MRNNLQRTNAHRKTANALVERLQAFSDELRGIESLNGNAPGEQVRASVGPFFGADYLEAPENLDDVRLAQVVMLAKIRQDLTQLERKVLRYVELVQL